MNLLDPLYLTAALLGSPFLAYKAATNKKYRTGLAERLGRVAPREGDAPCVWIHAVSVGETQVIKPLVPAIADAHAEWDRVISNATYTGQANARGSDVRIRHTPRPASGRARFGFPAAS